MCVSASISLSIVFSPIREFELSVEPSWPGHPGLGQKPKVKPDETKLKAKLGQNHGFNQFLAHVGYENACT